MTIKLSTGLRNYMLDTGSFKAAFPGGANGSRLRIFSGSPPADADAAETGTLLVNITNNSTTTGITFDTATAGTIAKTPSETWSGVNAATNTAGYFRLTTGTADGGGSSTTLRRLQGSVGVSGADLNLSSVSLTSGATQTIDFFSVALPTP